jgi:hypothetical protein
VSPEVARLIALGTTEKSTSGPAGPSLMPALDRTEAPAAGEYRITQGQPSFADSIVEPAAQ